MENTIFGSKISERIDRLGIDQVDLAKAIEVSPGYISDMIRLNRIPGGRRLVRVARLLETTAEYLVDDEIPIGAYPGLSAREEAILRQARIVGLDEAERRILKARETAEQPSHPQPRTDRDWGGDVLPAARPRDQGKPRSG